MPIYEYQCADCEHKLEALQKISEEPLVECPACGKSSLSKLVSAASFRLKGGGWYETDFKTGNKKQLAESESSAPKSGDSAKSGGEKAGSDSSATKTSSSKDGAGGSSKGTAKGNEPKKASSKATSN